MFESCFLLTKRKEEEEEKNYFLLALKKKKSFYKKKELFAFVSSFPSFYFSDLLHLLAIYFDQSHHSPSPIAHLLVTVTLLYARFDLFSNLFFSLSFFILHFLPFSISYFLCFFPFFFYPLYLRTDLSSSYSIVDIIWSKMDCPEKEMKHFVSTHKTRLAHFDKKGTY